MLWGAVGLFSWGLGDYLARFIAMRVGSLSTALLIQVIGLAMPLVFVLAALAAAAGPDVDWRAVAVWAPLSAAFLGGGYASFYTGLQRGTVTIVSSASSAWLAVTVIAAVLLFGERVSAGQGALLACVLGGILMLSAHSSTRTGQSTGMAWGLGATVGLGMALAFLDQATEAAGPMLAVLVVRALSTAPIAGLMLARREPLQLPSGRKALLLLAAVGLLDATGFIGFNLGVDAAPVSVVAPVASAHPVVTGGLAVLLLRERPRALQWTGAAVTVAAVAALSALTGS
ncbi:MAG: DMT family transporter [Chloroflexota bacterium]|nr:DMT family transporter [Chloroflexota bacterium]MDE2969150.1 DMT family transporter [Chloroflexota bacterium]